ncbi:MAG: heavy metal-associated domain-containing protein [Bacteroidales bacterium]|jgi:copper chaperone CopZ|nr:heavy metal-associated domain-containing protein [Bacteroidales bacterium]HOI31607.1 heavy metal-associated domain-containing protein [Bacteroidales bacterium]
MDTKENFARFSVQGMECNHCKNNVELNLSKLPQIKSVEADLITQTVKIEGKNFTEEDIKNTVESLGYKFGGKLS